MIFFYDFGILRCKGVIKYVIYDLLGSFIYDLNCFCFYVSNCWCGWFFDYGSV